MLGFDLAAIALNLFVQARGLWKFRAVLGYGLDILAVQVCGLFFQLLQQFVVRERSQLVPVDLHLSIERLFLEAVAFGCSQVTTQVG